jgi:arylsulfatase A-like enzyme
MKQKIVVISLALAFLFASFGELHAAEVPKQKPNIVYILADHMGYADAEFNAGRQIKTPSLKKLAKAGTVLSSFYGQPVCSPTRSSLMTGRYVAHTGVYSAVRPHPRWGLPLAERTLAEALQEAGYETAITGKWHLGEFQPAYLPTKREFEHQYGLWFGMIDYFTHLRDGSGTSIGKAAVRDGDWKLVHGETDASKSDEDLLFNLADDIREKNNLADKNPEKLAEMKGILNRLLKDAVPSGESNAKGGKQNAPEAD